MKKLLCLTAIFAFNYSFGQTIPTPDHILIVMYENRDYTEIVGNPSAPYINSLLSDTSTALFTNSNGLASGSQPNYLMLFSGSDQGVVDNTITSTQFTSCNLGYSLTSSGHTFRGYSEDLPSVGYLGTSSGMYYRKHNPWSNWQGTGANQLPDSLNLPLTYLPGSYDSLSTVSFIVPNQNDDMHTPSDSTGIAPGDAWLHTHLDSYIHWAKTHNSLVIFTFDESSAAVGEHILTFFSGQYVHGGSYGESIDNYRILRSIEDMYHLSLCGNSSSSTPITSFWKVNHTGIKENAAETNEISLWPVPSTGNLNLNIKSTVSENITIVVSDPLGRIVMQKNSEIGPGANQLHFNF